MKISEVINSKVAILCEKEEEAVKLCKFLKEKGFAWNSGLTLDGTHWEKQRNGLYYKLGTNRHLKDRCVRYGNKSDNMRSYKIISCGEFLKSNISILDINYRLNEDK